MRLRTTAILATAAFGLAIPASGLAEVPTAIGTGKKTCVPKRGASCKGITDPRVNLAGRDLRGVKFQGAHLRHADFRDADLRGARFEGAKLRGADFSGARLKGAHFGPPTTTRKGANQGQPTPGCSPQCSGTDLGGANFYEALLPGANLTSANLSSANLTSANLSSANLSSANLTSANLSSANLTSANLSSTNLTSVNLYSANLTNSTLSDAICSTLFDAYWSNTIGPNGTTVNGISC